MVTLLSLHEASSYEGLVSGKASYRNTAKNSFKNKRIFMLRINGISVLQNAIR